MARSKLGPIPDEWFEHDIPNIPDADKAYGPKFHDRMGKLAERIAQTRDRAQVEKAYNPNQPREPKGSSEGGRWTDGTSSAQAELKKLARRMKAELSLSESSVYDNAQQAKFQGDGWYALFTAKGDTVYFDTMSVDSDKQGSGTAKNFLGKLMGVFEEIGVKEIKLSADDVGAYTWARFGFRPNPDDVDNAMREAHDRLSKIPLVQVAKEEAMGAIKRKDIWAISDMDLEIIDSPYSRGWSTLGKDLLVNNNWVGSLRLDDEEAMARFNAYTGRRVKKAYDPNQPREPKGSPTGGRWVEWVDADTGGELTKEKAAELIKKTIVFHGTTEEALESILEKGLIPKSGTSGADAWMRMKDPALADTMAMTEVQFGIAEERKASVFVTEREEVALQYAKWVSEVNPGSDALLLAIQVPADSYYSFDIDEMSGDNEGGLALASLRRKGGVPREWIKAYRVFDPGTTTKYKKGDDQRTLYAVIICQPRTAKAGENSDEMFVDLLSDDDNIEHVIERSKQRMKARGLSQEAIDLAFGKKKA